MVNATTTLPRYEWTGKRWCFSRIVAGIRKKLIVRRLAAILFLLRIILIVAATFKLRVEGNGIRGTQAKAVRLRDANRVRQSGVAATFKLRSNDNGIRGHAGYGTQTVSTNPW